MDPFELFPTDFAEALFVAHQEFLEAAPPPEDDDEEFFLIFEEPDHA